MRNFTLTELNHRSGEVIEATYRGPVSITKHGKPRFVMMTSDHYERLQGGGDPRQAYRMQDMPDEHRELFGAAIEKLAAGEGYDDDE